MDTNTVADAARFDPRQARNMTGRFGLPSSRQGYAPTVRLSRAAAGPAANVTRRAKVACALSAEEMPLDLGNRMFGEVLVDLSDDMSLYIWMKCLP